MKTKLEAAEEYANSRIDNDYTIETEMAFNAGIEFAESWINVEDELPTVENSFLNKEVLTFTETKNGKGFYHLGVYTEGDAIVFYNENEDCEGFLAKGWYQESEQVNSEYDTVFISIKPTHWRPINRP